MEDGKRLKYGVDKTVEIDEDNKWIDKVTKKRSANTERNTHFIEKNICGEATALQEIFLRRVRDKELRHTLTVHKL